jgi:hypothetical protein
VQRLITSSIPMPFRPLAPSLTTEQQRSEDAFSCKPDTSGERIRHKEPAAKHREEQLRFIEMNTTHLLRHTGSESVTDPYCGAFLIRDNNFHWF